MRKHRLYGFCLALATVAGVALQRPGTADAATGTTGLPIIRSTTHHQRTKSPALVDDHAGPPSPKSIADVTRLAHDLGRRDQGSLLYAPLYTSGNGLIHANTRAVIAERQAENLRRLAAAVHFANTVALFELAHAATVAKLQQAYLAYQAAAATVRAQVEAQQAQAQQAAVAPAVISGGPVAGGVWAALRQCESGGNYAENTGNGYYGAYQFSLGTWASLGYGGLPSAAPPAVQDAAAQALQARSGWGQWPVCSVRIGM